MISTILKCAICAIKLIAFAAALYFIFCVFAFGLFLFVMSHDAGFNSSDTDSSTGSEPSLTTALPPARARLHNQTETIQNDILITPTPKKPKQNQAKRQPQTQTATTSKPLNKMTSKELLSLAKERKIKGYSAIYRTQKKPGLLRLIEENSFA